MNWQIASLVALICWGIWGVFLKQATKYFGWQQILVVSSIATVAASLTVFIILRPNISVSSPGFSYSLLAGVVSAIALLAFYSALEGGKATIVVPLTALYPIVTVVLSFLILSERISPIKAVGVVLSLVAILLLSIE
jgi:bacterial/archaeal transporter family protein